MFSARTQWDTAPNRLSTLLAERRRRQFPILDLTQSNPTACGFEFDQDAILQALAGPEALRYAPDPRGSEQARQAVADYYAGQGIRLEPRRILLTTGTSEAYSHVFRLIADTGDEILVPSPSYPLFSFLADLNDVKLVPYSLLYDDGWRIDLDALRAATTPRTRAIVVVTPNNPTGSLLQPDEASQLLELAGERELSIIADEVFRDYIWDATATFAPSMAAADRCLTFTLNGLSKISALPQMKLGWVVTNGPDDLLQQALARLEIIADTYLSVSTPVQAAAPALLDVRRSLRPQIMRRIRANLAVLDAGLGRFPLCSRLRAEGGWYAVVRVPNTLSDEAWALDLLATSGVYVHPGRFFDFGSGNFLVLSLITPEDEFREGIERGLGRIGSQA